MAGKARGRGSGSGRMVGGRRGLVSLLLSLAFIYKLHIPRRWHTNKN